MRKNLVDLLDYVGIDKWLNIATTELLFSQMAHLAQTASALTYPVFVDGKDYNGTPNMVKNPLLNRYLTTHFGKLAAQLNDAIYIPLGDKPKEALSFLVAQGILDKSKVLDELPHPSGVNGERIAYFLGRKNVSSLSVKTNPEKLDLVRNKIVHQVTLLKNN